jgi:hypothetical protein
MTPSSTVGAGSKSALNKNLCKLRLNTWSWMMQCSDAIFRDGVPGKQLKGTLLMPHWIASHKLVSSTCGSVQHSPWTVGVGWSRNEVGMGFGRDQVWTHRLLALLCQDLLSYFSICNQKVPFQCWGDGTFSSVQDKEMGGAILAMIQSHRRATEYGSVCPQEAATRFFMQFSQWLEFSSINIRVQLFIEYQDVCCIIRLQMIFLFTCIDIEDQGFNFFAASCGSRQKCVIFSWNFLWDSVTFWLSCGIFYSNFENKLCLLIFRWLKKYYGI